MASAADVRPAAGSGAKAGKCDRAEPAPGRPRESEVVAAFQVVLKRRPELSFLSLRDRENLRDGQARSKRSAFITLVHAATKSLTNFSFASALA